MSVTNPWESDEGDRPLSQKNHEEQDFQRLHINLPLHPHFGHPNRPRMQYMQSFDPRPAFGFCALTLNCFSLNLLAHPITLPSAIAAII